LPTHTPEQLAQLERRAEIAERSERRIALHRLSMSLRAVRMSIHWHVGGD
jgi:hypothetical protein